MVDDQIVASIWEVLMGMRLRGPRTWPVRLGLVGAASQLRLDALDFCWTLAGREHGTGLLATDVPF